VEGTKTDNQKIGSLGKEFGIHKHRLSALTGHIESSDDVLALSLSLIALSLMEQVLHKRPVLAG
jgi:hypothetical protein